MEHPVFGPDRAIVGPKAVSAYRHAVEQHERYAVPFGNELDGYARSRARLESAREIAAMYYEYGGPSAN